MRKGLYVPNFGLFADPRVVASLAAEAEAAGWEGMFFWDHVVRREADLPVADPWILLASVFGATATILAGPMVTPLARRRPWNVGKTAVTLDQMSSGRLVLGVGLGTSRGPEFPAFGEECDLRVRGDMLDEGIDILHQMWSGEPVVHEGRHYHLDAVRFLPRPYRPSGIPIWAATESWRGRPVRRAAGLDGVFPIGITPEEVVLLREVLAEHHGEPERPFDIAVADIDSPVHATRAVTPDVRRWTGSGATWWLRLLPYDATLGEVRTIVDRRP